jgi:hypothetical protein
MRDSEMAATRALQLKTFERFKTSRQTQSASRLARIAAAREARWRRAATYLCGDGTLDPEQARSLQRT